MNREEMISTRVKEHYDYLTSKGYEVVCTMLQGSQNYGLDEYTETYQSDIDTKSIVLPSLNDIVNATTPISIVEVMDNDEHAEVKDIRVMCDMFLKMNISYIELLYSKFIVVNSKYTEYVKLLFEMREALTVFNTNQFLKCICGMAYEKQKALCHPYPATMDKIEKWGYDGKQLSHAARLWEFILRYTTGEPISACYQSKLKPLLMNFKKQQDHNGETLSKEAAIELCDWYVAEVKRIKDEHLDPEDKTRPSVAAALNKWKAAIIKKRLKEEILNENN